MRAMRVVAAWMAAFGVACSFDWSTTPLSVDAGARDAGSDSPPDAPSADGGDCASLAKALRAARTSAKRCTSTAGACTATTTDECACTITVAADPSQATSDYRAALAAFQAAHCTPTCAQCVAPQPGLCVVGQDLQTYCMPL